MRSLAVVLLALLTVLTVLLHRSDVAAAKPGDLRLSAIASELARRPVTIHCEGFSGALTGARGESGRTEFIGGKPVDVKPFGNVKFDKRSKQTVVQEVREPPVDIIEESNRILVIAEMPGVTADDIALQLHGDVMEIEAHRGAKRYRKEVLLPKPASQDKTSISCNNGIVQIECRLE